jgi:hypothetical protein
MFHSAHDEDDEITKDLHIFALRCKISSQRQNEQNARRAVMKFLSRLLSTTEKLYRYVPNVNMNERRKKETKLA